MSIRVANFSSPFRSFQSFRFTGDRTEKNRLFRSHMELICLMVAKSHFNISRFGRICCLSHLPLTAFFNPFASKMYQPKSAFLFRGLPFFGASNRCLMTEFVYIACNVFGFFELQWSDLMAFRAAFLSNGKKKRCIHIVCHMCPIHFRIIQINFMLVEIVFNFRVVYLAEALWNNMWHMNMVLSIIKSIPPSNHCKIEMRSYLMKKPKIHNENRQTNVNHLNNSTISHI